MQSVYQYEKEGIILVVIDLHNISKKYKIGQVEVSALKKIDLTIKKGEFVSIMGPSGSGKSTMLNIIGCLDRPSTGTYQLSGNNVEKLRDGTLADIRNEFIGFVFQRFHLLPRLNALENVQLPLIYRGVSGKDRREKAKNALEIVGLADRMRHVPPQLSGGEQQRVAIARAIAMEPSVILADEPTGALDSKTGINIMHVFQELNREGGITVVQVTHSEEMAEYGEKIVRILDGEIERIDVINQ